MEVPTNCPKCSSTVIWAEERDSGIALNCMCGWSRWMAHKDGTLYKEEGDPAKLPRESSKLYGILKVIQNKQTCSTEYVANRVNEDSGKVATHLSVLKSSGLVECVDDRKGVAGGSIWELSPGVEALMGEAIQQEVA